MVNYLDKFSLKNKISFVVGGAGLIGKEISIALSQAGSRTFIFDINKNSFNGSTDKEKLIFEYFDCSNLDNLEHNFVSVLERIGSRMYL